MSIRTREQLGAGTGIVVAALLAIAFVVGISPEPPDLDAGPAAWLKYVAAQQDALQVQILLTSLAMLFFLWFLGSVRAGARSAEGGAGRVSAIASGGGIVGAASVLMSNVFLATAAYRPLETSPDLTRTLVDLSVLTLGVGAAAFAVFFLAVGVVSILDGGLPAALGWLAVVVAAAMVIGVVTIFTTTGVFSGDGAFGYWLRYAGFTIWVFVASIVLVRNAPKTLRRS
jgi:hypothetical protein